MTDINTVTIVGRLTRDCGTNPNGKDFAYTQSGMCIARISIAVNRSKKQADGSFTDEVSFFDVTVFGKTAENLKPYLLKGRQLVVQGHLQQDRWQDQGGNNRSHVSIIADTIQLAGGGQTQNGSGQQSYNKGNSYPPTRQTGVQQAPVEDIPPASSQGKEQPFREDLPWDDSIPF